MHNSNSFIIKLFYDLIANRTNLCAGCEKEKIFHENETEEKWTYQNCTKVDVTDAYGKLNFPGSHSKYAYVCIC
jgi:hypothetical protein